MQTACWQLCFPIVLRELGTRHASPPRFDPVESVAPPQGSDWQVAVSILSRRDYNRTMRISGTPVRFMVLPALLLWALTAYGDTAMTKILIQVKTQSGRAIEGAEVVVHFSEGRSGLRLGKNVLIDYDLHTNQKGEAKIPAIPQGKIKFIVSHNGYQTYGQVLEIKEEEKTVEIVLNPPQPQYSAH